MFDFLQRSWNVLIFTGIAAVIFGIVAILWPGGTAVTLVLIWGWYALIDGVIEIGAAFRPESGATRALLVFTGIIGIVAGLIAIFQPVASAVALAWILGIWLVVRGVVSLFSAFSLKLQTPRWMLVLSAACFILAGVIFIINPGAAALTLSIWLGVLALIWGISILVAGFGLHRSVSKTETTV